MNLSGIINQERLVSTFLDLVDINSPSYEERKMGAILASMLEKAGCSVEFQEYDQSFNIFAFRRGNSSSTGSLLLSAHMDTIEPTEGISYSVEDGVIRTTGKTVLGADDKSAIAQIIEALTALRESVTPHCDLEIIFTSAEEKGLVGAKHFDFSKVRSRHCIVLDSSGSVGRIITGSPSHLTYEMTIIGRAAHAGLEPEKGKSAIKAASSIITALPDGRLDSDTTANVGVINGGTATNVVPEEVVIKGEVRSHNDLILKKVKEDIFSVSSSIAEKEGVRIKLSDQLEYGAFRIKEDDPFLVFLSGIYSDCGIKPECAVAGGGSDASVINAAGIRAINLSNGMQNVHSKEEYITIKDLVAGCEIVVHATAGFAKFLKQAN